MEQEPLDYVGQPRESMSNVSVQVACLKPVDQLESIRKRVKDSIFFLTEISRIEQ